MTEPLSSNPLVLRLRQRLNSLSSYYDTRTGGYKGEPDKDCIEAADEIDRLTAELEAVQRVYAVERKCAAVRADRLRAALETADDYFFRVSRETNREVCLKLVSAGRREIDKALAGAAEPIS